MTDATMQSHDGDPRRLLGEYLRAHTTSAKDLARRISCDPRSAIGYRAGTFWPQATLWPRIIAAFGRDVTDAVFHPEQAAARLHQEVIDLEARLAERKAALRAVANETGRPRARLAADDCRAARA